jgi:hypothetical protein
MSEVKSAREVSERILDSAIDFDLEVYDIKQMISIIQSDRRAIIEKCKEAIHEEAKLYSPNVAKFDYSYCWAIIDSAFAEIEGGK